MCDPTCNSACHAPSLSDHVHGLATYTVMHLHIIPTRAQVCTLPHFIKAVETRIYPADLRCVHATHTYIHVCTNFSDLACRESWRRSHLWSLVRHLGDSLGVPALSPVVPLVVGSEAEALRLGALMLSKGFHVPAIRPPTVPPGTCRLRVSLSAAHTRQDIDDLVAAVKASGAQLQALPHLVDQQRLHQQQGVTLPFGWASDHVSGHHRSRL